MKKYTSIALATLACAFPFACGVDDQFEGRRSGTTAASGSESAKFDLSSVTPDGRVKVPVTWNASPWVSPLTASAATVANLGLTTDVVTTSDTQSNMVFDMRHTAIGEGVDLEILRTLLQRYSVRRGYTNFNTFLSDYRNAARSPAFKLAAPTGDTLKDMIAETNQLVLGTAGTKTIVGVSCGGCHTYTGAKVLLNGSRVLVAENFSAAQPARVTTPVDAATVFSDIDALLAAGPNATDPVELKAQYSLMKLAREKMDRPECDGAAADPKTGAPEHWKCSKAFINALAANSSARDVIDRGYLIALAIGAGASDLGAPFTTSSITDAELETASLPYEAASFDWGGKRANITAQLLGKDPLTIDKRAQRNANMFRFDGAMAASSTFSFGLSYVNGGSGVYGMGAYQGYLFGATYVRLPTLTSSYLSSTALAAGGFGTSAAEWTRFIAALPRYVTANAAAEAPVYFGHLAGGQSILPDAALGTVSYADFNTAMTQFNTSCGSCHGTVEAVSGDMNRFVLKKPSAIVSYISNGAQTSADIIAQVVAANGTANLPSITSRSIWVSPTWNASGVKSSPSYKVGPFRYTRMNPYAGHSDALAFLKAGGGQAAAGTYLIPRERNSAGAYLPIASSKDRLALTATYGRPEQTGAVKHPTFAAVDAVTADKLAIWLDTCMADGGCIVMQPMYMGPGMMGTIPSKKILAFPIN